MAKGGAHYKGRKPHKEGEPISKGLVDLWERGQETVLRLDTHGVTCEAASVLYPSSMQGEGCVSGPCKVFVKNGIKLKTPEVIGCRIR